MLTEVVKLFLEQRLSQQLARSIHILQVNYVGGGSINKTCQLVTDTKERFFLKINDAGLYPGLFDKERRGLESLRPFMRTPEVLLNEVFQGLQLMVTEWIEPGPKTERFWKEFGLKLAALHQHNSTSFGLAYDNYMGSLKQRNTQCDTWVNFFREQRIEPQVKLAVENGLLPKRWLKNLENLYSQLPSIFPEEKPCLVHGDLWSGNFICDQKQMPVLIDPAIYYGHRSVDLAMTTLFGRFHPVFYQAYHEQFPLPANYEEQWEIANLYPLLIHLNLFGGNYRESITASLERF